MAAGGGGAASVHGFWRGLTPSGEVRWGGAAIGEKGGAGERMGLLEGRGVGC